MIFTGGAPAQVVVQLTDVNVIVSAYAGIWVTADRFVAKPRRMGLLKWRRLPETLLMNAISTLIKGARDMRLASYRLCAICGKKYPPEALFDNVCVWCGEESPGVVH